MKLTRGAERLLEHYAYYSRRGFAHYHPEHTPACGFSRGGQCLIDRNYINASAKRFALYFEELVTGGLVAVESPDRIRLIEPEQPAKTKTPRQPRLPPEFRRAPSVKVRFELLKRDGFACVYCGRSHPDVVLCLDHKVPFSKGGLTIPGNLVTACVDCNAGKGAR